MGLKDLVTNVGRGIKVSTPAILNMVRGRVGTAGGPSSGFAANPYAIGSSMPKMSGPTTFTPVPMSIPSPSFDYSPARMSPFQGSLLRGSRYTNPDEIDDFTERMYGGEKDKRREPGSGVSQRIRDLFSGQSGAAIGGIAQGAGAVLGSYLEGRNDREVLKEEKRRRALAEAGARETEKLLMPLYEEMQRRRQKAQEEYDRLYGR